MVHENIQLIVMVTRITASSGKHQFGHIQKINSKTGMMIWQPTEKRSKGTPMKP